MTSQVLDVEVREQTAPGAANINLRRDSMFRKLLATSNDWTLGLLRLVMGVTFFMHGAQKMLGWFGGYGFSGTMGFFTNMMHIPAPFAVFALYPYLKRWTPLCHVGVGVALALAPLAGYAAAHSDLRDAGPAWGLGLFQLPFIYNFFASIKWGALVDKNPWEATTLEWSAPSPPGHGNFLTEPIVYRGPYEYSVPGSGRDFTPQFEPEKA